MLPSASMLDTCPGYAKRGNEYATETKSSLWEGEIDIQQNR
jgi:hypothetical protein